jgi:hypothetical protein
MPGLLRQRGVVLLVAAAMAAVALLAIAAMSLATALGGAIAGR